jgi:hypothetical protein
MIFFFHQKKDRELPLMEVSVPAPESLPGPKKWPSFPLWWFAAFTNSLQSCVKQEFFCLRDSHQFAPSALHAYAAVSPLALIRSYFFINW